MASGQKKSVSSARSPGLSYQELLDTDTKPAPPVLRLESPLDLPPTYVPLDRYTSRAFHDLEVEKMWKKTWQMACREEELVEVGDHHVYEVADISIVVVRSAENELRAFHNVCLHRGRKIKTTSGRSAHIRCPFHGWTWNLDGSLKEIPSAWDFAHLKVKDCGLPEVQVGTWGGFVFVNPDPEAGSLEDYLGELPQHFERWPLEKRFKSVHVARILPCNWKVAQEAFMEAYHVLGTHPQLLSGIGDTNSQYDAWENFSRAITPNGTPSPNLDWSPSEQESLDAVTNRFFDEDPVMVLPEDMTGRQLLGQASRVQMAPLVPGALELTDSEILDSFYYTLFPNFHPWGAYNRIIYRFRPHGNDPGHCIMEVMYLEPYRGKRPPPCEVHWLSEEEDFSQAPELGFLARVFNQDVFNLGAVQEGLRAGVQENLVFANYQETKIRHWHALLDKHIAR